MVIEKKKLKIVKRLRSKQINTSTWFTDVRLHSELHHSTHTVRRAFTAVGVSFVYKSPSQRYQPERSLNKQINIIKFITLCELQVPTLITTFHQESVVCGHLNTYNLF